MLMRPRALFVAALVFAGTAYAQTATPAPVCNAELAEMLVEQQVTENRSVSDPVKRIKILIRAADFLWKLDMPTARGYLAEAWKLAVDRFREVGHESNELARGVSTYVPDQRMDVLSAVAKYDAEWAKKLAAEIVAEAEKTAKDRKPSDRNRDADALLNLAVSMLATDPELSRFLLRKAAALPMTQAWFWTFFGLARTDRAFANAMYTEVLTAKRNERPRHLLYLSGYPFARSSPFGVDKGMMTAALDRSFTNDPALERLFIRTFLNRVTAFVADPDEVNRPAEPGYLGEPAYMVTALAELEPIVLQRFPDLVEPLMVARGQAQGLFTAEMQKAVDARNEFRDEGGETIDERIARLEKIDADGKLKDFDILRLILAASKTDEDYKKVESWLDKVKEDKVKVELTNYYWFRRTQLAIREKRLDDADKFLAKVPELEQKALLMFDIAALYTKNEHDISALFDVLNRLSKLARPVENSAAKAQILLGLANMYEKVNHSVAMEELSEAIRVINSQKEPDIFANYVFRTITGKEFGHAASFSTPGYNLETTFRDLSKKDFEISLAQARSLDDRFFRTVAVIAVATNCAAAQPKRTAAPKK